MDLNLELEQMLHDAAKKHDVDYKLAYDILNKERDAAHLQRRNSIQDDLKKLIRQHAKTL